MNASTCLIQDAGGHPKGIRKDIEIHDAESHNQKNNFTAVVIDCEGLVRFANPQGDTSEAVKGNLYFDPPQDPVILRVDMSKSVMERSHQAPLITQNPLVIWKPSIGRTANDNACLKYLTW